MNEPAATADATHSPQVPAAAFWLGAAGVVPFAAGAVAAWFVPADAAAQAVAVTTAYSALVLSFLGGTAWGFAAGRSAHVEHGVFGVILVLGVIPSLIGWAALFLPPGAGLAILAAGFGAMLLVDHWVWRLALAPAWWMHLRVRLSVAAISCLAVTMASPHATDAFGLA